QGDGAQRRALHRQIDEVPAREEHRVEHLEHRPDQREADDDRQRTQVAAAHPRPDPRRGAADALAVEIVEAHEPPPGRRRSREASGMTVPSVRGSGSAGGAARRATELSTAPVIAAISTSLVTSAALYSPLLRPSRSTTIRSATA